LLYLGLTNQPYIKVEVLSHIYEKFVFITGIFKHGLSVSKAYIADVTTVQERSSYLGYFNAVTSSGFIIGPFLAGYLTDYDPSLRLTILTGATIFSLNFMFTLLFLPASRKDLELKNKPSTDPSNCLSLHESIAKYFSWDRLREGFKLFHWENLTEVILIQFLASFAMLIFRNNLPVFLEESFVLSGSRYGQIMSFSALATTVFSATCGIVSKFYQNNNSKQLVHFMMLLFVSLAAFAFTSHLSYVLILLATVSLSTSNLRICMLNLILLQGREDEKGAVVGFMTALTSIARMLTPTLVGMLQEFGSRAAGLASASLALLALLGAVWFSLTRERKEALSFLFRYLSMYVKSLFF